MNLKNLNSNFNSLPRKFPRELEDQWVAVLQGKVIINNKSFKKVFKEAGEKNISKKVIFHKVPKGELIIV
tara:strand:+ start:177 stop:386 length:210 start_codon:yes stop_codon:yes gene_type:complete